MLYLSIHLASGGAFHNAHPADAAAAAALSRPLTPGGSVSLPSSPVTKAKPATLSRQGSQQLEQTTPRRQSSLAPSLLSPVRQLSAAASLPPVRQPSLAAVTLSKQASLASTAATLRRTGSNASSPSPALSAAFTRAAETSDFGSNAEVDTVYPLPHATADASAPGPGTSLPSSLSISVDTATVVPVADAQSGNISPSALQPGQLLNAEAASTSVQVPLPEPFVASAPLSSSPVPAQAAATNQPVVQLRAENSPQAVGTGSAALSGMHLTQRAKPGNVPMDTVMPITKAPAHPLHPASRSPDAAVHSTWAAEADLPGFSTSSLPTQTAEQQQSTLNAVAADYARMLGEQEEQKQASAAAEAGVFDLQPETTSATDLPQPESKDTQPSNASATELWDGAALIPAVLPPVPTHPSNRKAGSALFQMLAGELHCKP